MICKKCNTQFFYRRVLQHYCSLRCAGITKMTIRHDGLYWKEMWKNFWIRYYSLSLKSREEYFKSILDLMPERYVSNKIKDSYDLFKPNNIEI